MNKEKDNTGYFVIAIIVIIIFSGWIKNIIKLSNCNFEAPYKCEVIHTVGIIPPVGMITGWLNPED